MPNAGNSSDSRVGGCHAKAPDDQLFAKVLISRRAIGPQVCKRREGKEPAIGCNSTGASSRITFKFDAA